MSAERITSSERYPGFPQLEALNTDQFPQHVLIIPDGNRTWARQKGLSPMEGHMAGLNKTIEILRAARPLPIKRVSIWAFSYENNQRDAQEKANLYHLFGQGLADYTPELMEDDVKLEVLGDLDSIPSPVRQAFLDTMDETKNNSAQIVTVLVNFSGINQEVRINQKTALRVADLLRQNPNISDEVLKRSINEGWVKHLRDGEGRVTPADLIIRTKESRTSGIGWLNGESTALYLRPDKLYPDLNTDDIAQGILFYSKVTHNRGA
jgi:undecaprenyl diphosphate synthase